MISTIKTNLQKYYWIYIILTILTFSFYSNSINNSYSLDDELVATTDRSTNERANKGVSAFKEIFTTHYAINATQSYDYRPITTFSFAIEQSLFSDSENRPQISHFINILLYLLGAFILFNILQLLAGKEYKILNLIIVSLYILHPIHTEVVNNIKSRDELLVFVFGFMALYQFIKYYDSKKIVRLIVALILLLITVLSKSSGLIFIAIIPMCLYFFRDLKIIQVLKFIGILLIPIVIFNIMNRTIITTETSRVFEFFENPLFINNNLPDRFTMFFFCNLFYISMLIFPYPLRYYYGYQEFEIYSFGDWQFWVGFILVIALLFIAFKGLKKKTPYSFGILFYFFCIGGACNLLFPVPGIVAERFTFIASFGFCYVLGHLIYKIFKVNKTESSLKKPILITLVIIFIPSLIYVRDRNQDWNTKYSLFKNDIKHLENSAKANSLLASEYYINFNYKLRESGLYDVKNVMKYADSAEYYFLKAIEIFPEYPSALSNLSSINYMAKLDYVKGVEFGELAIKYDSNYIEGLYNLGSNYAEVTNGLYQLKELGANHFDSNYNIEESKYYFALNNMIRSKYLQKQLPNILNNKRGNSAQNLVDYVTQLDGKNDTLKNNSLGKKIITSIRKGESGNKLKSIFNAFEIQLYSYSLSNNNGVNIQNKYNLVKTKLLETYELARITKPDFFQTYKSIIYFLSIWKEYELYIEWNQKYIAVITENEKPPYFVNIGNAYLNLANPNKIKANENFNKAITILTKELNTLNSLQRLSNEQNNRRNYLNNEINKLKNFINQKVNS